jgi:hypothetical protein
LVGTASKKSRENYNWRFWDELVDTSVREGVTLLPYVCYTPKWAAARRKNAWREPPRNLDAFARFMAVIATRYRGKVRSWELSNEPDNRGYWRGSPKQFTRMFASAARADPDAVVVLGGLARSSESEFFRSLVTNHRLSRYFDVLNFHGYHETWDRTPAEEYLTRINSYAEAVAAAKAAPKRRIYGWLNSGTAVTCGRNLDRTLLRMTRCSIGRRNSKRSRYSGTTCLRWRHSECRSPPGFEFAIYSRRRR